MMELMEVAQFENDLTKLKTLDDENNKNIEDVEENINQNFIKNDLNEAKKNISILNYLFRLKTLLNEKFEKLEVEKFNNNQNENNFKTE